MSMKQVLVVLAAEKRNDMLGKNIAPLSPQPTHGSMWFRCFSNRSLHNALMLRRISSEDDQIVGVFFSNHRIS